MIPCQRYNYLVSILFFVGLNLFLIGCQNTKLIETRDNTISTNPVDYTIIYYIHADSDYLYHTSDGEPIRNNSAVLDTAITVAKGAKNGEVLIFIQQSEKKILGLFPRKGSTFFGYRHGVLRTKKNYRHKNSRENFLSTEALFSTEFRSAYQSSSHKYYFLYYGHEIPAIDGTGYHQSLKKMDVSASTFSRGLHLFIPEDTKIKFNLIALSTCNNGTPEMINQLMSNSQIVLASPQNLHLSHIQSRNLHLLEVQPTITALNLGNALAEHTFEYLSSTVKTPITLSLYNMDSVQHFITRLMLHSDNVNHTSTQVPNLDNIDCFESDKNEIPLFDEGVFTWYRPSKFGRNSSKTSHSGWGCRVINSQ